ncbi:hypothetical protein [Nocardia sp. N2S4-5]|uniref:hypothetical protein n=1 Tax=Nocardia sp. N2S4-5 TaxID=3351565 RepID=UPI0037D5C2E5
MMVATLKPTGPGTAGLEVTNAGPSIARKVKVTFDPALPEHEHAEDGQESLIPYVRRRFAEPIDAWAPGYTTRSEFIRRGRNRDDQSLRTNVDGIPRQTTIVFDYEDDDGNSYTDRMSLDPTLVEGETWSVYKRTKGSQETVVRDGAPWGVG